MPRKTLALIVGLIILAVVLLIVALKPLIFAPPGTEIPGAQVTVTPTPPAYTTLNLSPNPVNVTTGQGKVEVLVDTQQNSLTAAQLELSYDPNFLTNVEVTSGPFFPDPITLLNAVDAQNGRVTYAIGITPAQTPVQGQGVLANVIFDVVPGATGETQIELLPKSAVTQEGVVASVLKQASGTKIIITASQSPATNVPAQTNQPATKVPIQ